MREWLVLEQRDPGVAYKIVYDTSLAYMASRLQQGQRDLAEDVVLRIRRGRRRLSEVSCSIGAWTTGVSKRRLQEHYRERARRPKSNVHMRLYQDKRDSPSRQLIINEELSLIDSLPPPYRHVLLWKAQRLTYAQMDHILCDARPGKPGRAKRILRDARHMLTRISAGEPLDTVVGQRNTKKNPWTLTPLPVLGHVEEQGLSADEQARS